MIAVLLVGGEGTRLRPLTEWLPKPMLPIANRPFLEHQIEHLRSHGIEDVILSCGYLPGPIREHFGDRLRYAVEPAPLGTGGAIRFSAEGVDETFLVGNGDVLTDLDIGALVAFELTLQLQAADGSFHFLLRSDVKDLEYEQHSMMPPDYEKRLSRIELNDLVSYLMSVGRSERSCRRCDGRETPPCTCAGP